MVSIVIKLMVGKSFSEMIPAKEISHWNNRITLFLFQLFKLIRVRTKIARVCFKIATMFGLDD